MKTAVALCLCDLKTVHTVEDLLSVQSVLDTEGVLKIIVIDVVEKLAVDGSVDKSFGILTKRQCVQPLRHIFHTPS